MSAIFCTLFGLWCPTYSYGLEFRYACGYPERPSYQWDGKGNLQHIYPDLGGTVFITYGGGMWHEGKFIPLSREWGDRCQVYRLKAARYVDNFPESDD